MANYGKQYGSAREALLAQMSDCDWHTWKEMEAVAGNRYAARMLELRRLGYQIEDRPATTLPDGKEYRLLSTVPGPPKPKQVKVFMDEYDAQAVAMGTLTPAARAAVKDALRSFKTNKDKL